MSIWRTFGRVGFALMSARLLDLNADLGEGFGLAADDDAACSRWSPAPTSRAASTPATRPTMRRVCAPAACDARRRRSAPRSPTATWPASAAGSSTCRPGDSPTTCSTRSARSRPAPARSGDRVRYVKPHGALYNAVVRPTTCRPRPSSTRCSRLRRALPVLGLPGSRAAARGRRRRAATVPRGVRRPRLPPTARSCRADEPGAVLARRRRGRRAVRSAGAGGEVMAADGAPCAGRGRARSACTATPRARSSSAARGAAALDARRRAARAVRGRERRCGCCRAATRGARRGRRPRRRRSACTPPLRGGRRSPAWSSSCPAARTVLVAFDPAATDAAAVGAALRALDGRAGRRGRTGRWSRSPSRYDGADLDDVRAAAGLDRRARWSRRAPGRAPSGSAFCGFAPGFAYLDRARPGAAGAAPARPRGPRCRPGRSALAGAFAGVYPRESPGGWQLLGRTDAVAVGRRPGPAGAARARHAGPLRGRRDLLEVLAARPAHDRPGPRPARAGARSASARLGRRRPGAACGWPTGWSATRRRGGRPRGHARRAAGALRARRARSRSPARRRRSSRRRAAAAVRWARRSASPAGDELRARRRRRAGVRTYLAVRGRHRRAGRCSARARTDLLVGLGPAGRCAAGDPAAGAAPRRPRRRASTSPRWPSPPAASRAAVPPGPARRLVRRRPRSRSGRGRTTVTPRQQPGRRCGSTGPPLRARARRRAAERGHGRGALQVPPDGQPVLFLADHPVTGGYPVIASSPGRHPAAAQARPGTRLRFVNRTLKGSGPFTPPRSFADPLHVGRRPAPRSTSSAGRICGRQAAADAPAGAAARPGWRPWRSPPRPRAARAAGGRCGRPRAGRARDAHAPADDAAAAGHQQRAGLPDQPDAEPAALEHEAGAGVQRAGVVADEVAEQPERRPLGRVVAPPARRDDLRAPARVERRDRPRLHEHEQPRPGSAPG